MLFRSFCFATAVASSLALTASQAQAVPVLEYSGGSGAGSGGNPFTAGWSFTTNSPVVVTALDALGLNSANGNEVRIYDGNGTVLANADVLPTDPKEGTPASFFTHAITPVTLAADTMYYIVEDFTTPGALTAFPSSITTYSVITFGNTVAQVGAGGTPTSNQFGFGGGEFGPNFDVQVPEPASVTLMSMGALGIAMVRRRRARMQGAAA